MGQWFRIRCCLKIYFVLVLVADCTVQQSIFGRGSFEELFLLHYLGHRFRGLFECILAICNQLSDLVEVYHEEHIREFRICIKTAQRNNLLI